MHFPNFYPDSVLPKKDKNKTKVIFSQYARSSSGVRSNLEPEVPADLGADDGQLLSHALHILVTTTRQADDDVLVLLHRLGELHGAEDGVAGLEGGDDTLELAEVLKAEECFGIGGGDEACAAAVLPAGELRADTRVVETGGHGVGVLDLAILVLQNVGTHTVEDTRLATSESGTVAVGLDTITASLNTEELDAGILREGEEHTSGVAATANTSNNSVGETASKSLHLLLGLVADDTLESTNDGGEGVRTNGRANDVVSGVEPLDPLAESLVDSVTECAGTSFDGNNGGTKELHAEYVEGLTADIFSAHEDSALHAEASADSGGGNTVLTSTSFGNDLSLAEPPCEQDLADGVVDLVRSSVVEVLALEVDVCTKALLRGPQRQAPRRRGRR